MSSCAGRGALTNGLSKFGQRERISSLEGINLVVRAFKKEMQKHNRRFPITGNSDASDRKSITPEPLEGSGALAEPELT